MSKKKKWKSGRSNLFKIGVVFLLATVAILAVRFGNFGPRYIRPEEHAQLAERRISPDNAFHILIEAGGLLPKKALRLPCSSRQESRTDGSVRSGPRFRW